MIMFGGVCNDASRDSLCSYIGDRPLSLLFSSSIQHDLSAIGRRAVATWLEAGDHITYSPAKIQHRREIWEKHILDTREALYSKHAVETWIRSTSARGNGSRIESWDAIMHRLPECVL